MKKQTTKTVIVALAAIILTFTLTPALDNGQALTPPMGWNSWNWFGCHNSMNRGELDEALVKGIADAMVSSGMKDAGYEYVVLDDCWAEPNRDMFGGLVPARTQFPGGIRPLVDYVHGNGLKMGIYLDAGELTCARTMPGSLNHEQQDADTLAAWGVDYLKYDWCGREGNVALNDYIKMRDALKAAAAKNRAAGNPNAPEILYSICNWGVQQPWTWGEPVGNMWRTTMDIEYRWGKIMEILDLQVMLYPYAKPGAWNDPDMLEVGNGLTISEDRAHFSLWCILAAPLIAGNDLRNMSEATKSILRNREVIAVDQDALGLQGKRVKKAGNLEVWAKMLQGEQYAVVFFNRGMAPADISVTWAQLRDGIGADIEENTALKARDLWQHTDIGTYTGSFVASTVPGHDVMMIRLADPASSGIDQADFRTQFPLHIHQTGHQIEIDFDKRTEVRIVIADMAGRVVFRINGKGPFTWQVTVGEKIKAGLYIIRAETGKKTFSRKMTIMGSQVK